jgi:hypothetical protein
MSAMFAAVGGLIPTALKNDRRYQSLSGAPPPARVRPTGRNVGRANASVGWYECPCAAGGWPVSKAVSSPRRMAMCCDDWGHRWVRLSWRIAVMAAGHELSHQNGGGGGGQRASDARVSISPPQSGQRSRRSHRFARALRRRKTQGAHGLVQGRPHTPLVTRCTWNACTSSRPSRSGERPQNRLNLATAWT